MSVYVIDTIKPKNNGSFPIVEAVDVLVDAQRLPAALNAKANQTDLAALSSTVSGKASQADLEALTTVVNGKASAADLADTNAAVALKASQADLYTVNEAVAGKANASDVTTATTNLQSQIDNIVTPVTVDAEVINARVGADGTSYVSLKSRLDAENANVKSDISASNVGIVGTNSIIRASVKDIEMYGFAPDSYYIQVYRKNHESSGKFQVLIRDSNDDVICNYIGDYFGGIDRIVITNVNASSDSIMVEGQEIDIVIDYTAIPDGTNIAEGTVATGGIAYNRIEYNNFTNDLIQLISQVNDLKKLEPVVGSNSVIRNAVKEIRSIGIPYPLKITVFRNNNESSGVYQIIISNGADNIANIKWPTDVPQLSKWITNTSAEFDGGTMSTEQMIYLDVDMTNVVDGTSYTSLTFEQGGIGDWTNTVKTSKLNAIDFLKADGVTDDTAALQYLLNYQPDVDIYFPKGRTVIITRPVYSNLDGVRLHGYDSIIKIKDDSGLNEYMIEAISEGSQPQPLITFFGNNSGIDGFEIDGNMWGNPYIDANGVFYADCTGQSTAGNFGFVGICLAGSNGYATNNYVHDVSWAGIISENFNPGFKTWKQAKCGSNKIEYNRITTTYRDGIAVHNSDYTSVKGNTLNNCAWHDIHDYNNVANTIIEDNVCNYTSSSIRSIYPQNIPMWSKTTSIKIGHANYRNATSINCLVRNNVVTVDSSTGSAIEADAYAVDFMIVSNKVNSTIHVAEFVLGKCQISDNIIEVSSVHNGIIFSHTRSDVSPTWISRDNLIQNLIIKGNTIINDTTAYGIYIRVDNIDMANAIKRFTLEIADNIVIKSKISAVYFGNTNFDRGIFYIGHNAHESSVDMVNPTYLSKANLVILD